MKPVQTNRRLDSRAYLLPWYVNETLEPAERRRVEEHLESCSHCADEVRELRRIAAVVGGEPTAPLVPEPQVDAFLHRLGDKADVEPNGRRERHVWAIAASLFLVVMAGAIIVAGQRTIERPVFETVTDVSGGAVSYVFALDHTEENWEQNRQAMLDHIPGASLSSSGGEYQLVVSIPSATVTELNLFAESLQALEGIERVTWVGVQIPVE